VFASIPAWVTAILLVVGVVGGLLVAGWIIGRVSGHVFARTVARKTGSMFDEIDSIMGTKRAEIKSLEDVHAEAFAMVKTVEAFELNESIPLKLRQIAAALRMGQLKHRYDTAIQALQYVQAHLLAARKDVATHSSNSYYTDRVVHLENLQADLETKLVEMEPLLEQWGVAYERLTSRLRAV